VTARQGPCGLGKGRRDSLSALRETAEAVLGPRPPEPGERVSGHGLTGTVLVVADTQPLAADHIWRVGLAGEPFNRLVKRDRASCWHLLQLDELSEAQMERMELHPSEKPVKELLTTL